MDLNSDGQPFEQMGSAEEEVFTDVWSHPKVAELVTENQLIKRKNKVFLAAVAGLSLLGFCLLITTVAYAGHSDVARPPTPPAAGPPPGPPEGDGEGNASDSSAWWRRELTRTLDEVTGGVSRAVARGSGQREAAAGVIEQQIARAVNDTSLSEPRAFNFELTRQLELEPTITASLTASFHAANRTQPVSQTYRFGIDFALVHTSGGAPASSAVVAAKSDGVFLLNTDPCGAAGGGAGEEAAVLLYAWSRFGGACGWTDVVARRVREGPAFSAKVVVVCTKAPVTPGEMGWAGGPVVLWAEPETCLELSTADVLSLNVRVARSPVVSAALVPGVEGGLPVVSLHVPFDDSFASATVVAAGSYAAVSAGLVVFKHLLRLRASQVGFNITWGSVAPPSDPFITLRNLASPNPLPTISFHGDEECSTSFAQFFGQLLPENLTFVTATLPVDGTGDGCGFEVDTQSTHMKTAEETALVGGLTKAMCNPCYGLACDTSENVDVASFVALSQAVATTLSLLADDMTTPFNDSSAG